MLGIKMGGGGLFGARKPYGTPGIGDEADPNKMGLPPMAAPGLGMEAQSQRPGLGTRLFGQGWEDKAYGIGGILQGDGGAAYEKVRERNMAPLLAEAQRQAALADYEAKKRIDQQYQAPPNNDTLNDMAAAASWTPAQWAIYDKLHPVYRVGPDGIPYPMARGGNAAPPTAPVGKLTPIGGGPQVPPAGNF